MLQVMNLTLLAPEIQERILSGDLQVPPRRFRRVTREMAWATQVQLSLNLENEADSLPRREGRV